MDMFMMFLMYDSYKTAIEESTFNQVAFWTIAVFSVVKTIIGCIA